MWLDEGFGGNWWFIIKTIRWFLLIKCPCLSFELKETHYWNKYGWSLEGKCSSPVRTLERISLCVCQNIESYLLFKLIWKYQSNKQFSISRLRAFMMSTTRPPTEESAKIDYLLCLCLNYLARRWWMFVQSHFPTIIHNYSEVGANWDNKACLGSSFNSEKKIYLIQMV